MDYRNVSKDEAVKIIQNAGGNTIIKYERGGCGLLSIEHVNKNICEKIIWEADRVSYNDDEYTPNIDLFFGSLDTDRYVKLLFKHQN